MHWHDFNRSFCARVGELNRWCPFPQIFSMPRASFILKFQKLKFETVRVIGTGWTYVHKLLSLINLTTRLIQGMGVGTWTHWSSQLDPCNWDFRHPFILPLIRVVLSKLSVVASWAASNFHVPILAHNTYDKSHYFEPNRRPITGPCDLLFLEISMH